MSPNLQIIYLPESRQVSVVMAIAICLISLCKIAEIFLLSRVLLRNNLILSVHHVLDFCCVVFRGAVRVAF
jgi:hypothetical protein